VGGYAIMKYTEPRYTKDLDVWVEASQENARAVFAALREFGAPLSGLSASDFAREGSIYQMGRPPARVDVLTSIDGVRFADAWPRRVVSDFDGMTVQVMSRQDLLVNKRAVGRHQDLADVERLLEAERIQEKPAAEPKPRRARSARKSSDRER
jgi:hypothetical protein